jgi:hypothetical protein
MSETAAPPNSASEQGRTLIERLKDNDLLASFPSSKVTIAAGIVTIILFLAALLAPWIAPTDPFNPATNYITSRTRSIRRASSPAETRGSFWGRTTKGGICCRRFSMGSACRSRSAFAAWR